MALDRLQRLQKECRQRARSLAACDLIRRKQICAEQVYLCLQYPDACKPLLLLHFSWQDHQIDPHNRPVSSLVFQYLLLQICQMHRRGYPGHTRFQTGSPSQPNHRHAFLCGGQQHKHPLAFLLVS